MAMTRMTIAEAGDRRRRALAQLGERGSCPRRSRAPRRRSDERADGAPEPSPKSRMITPANFEQQRSPDPGCAGGMTHCDPVGSRLSPAARRRLRRRGVLLAGAAAAGWLHGGAGRRLAAGGAAGWPGHGGCRVRLTGRARQAGPAGSSRILRVARSSGCRFLAGGWSTTLVRRVRERRRSESPRRPRRRRASAVQAPKIRASS